MSGKTKKKFVLKQCVVPLGSNISLESVISEIGTKFPNHKDRTFKTELFRSRSISYVKPSPNGKPGFFVGFCLLDESAIGLADSKTSNETIDVEEFDVPKDKAWLDSEVVLYIVKNHVIACNIGNNEKAISTIITDLAKSGDILADDKHLVLSDVPNKLTIEHVHKVGVKHIDLDISSYLASLDYVKSKKADRTIFSSIFQSPISPEDVTRRTKSTGRLFLSRGGKFKKEEIAQDEWLTKIGADILSEGVEDYTITLEDGNQISSSKLRVNKTVSLNKKGNNTFSREHAHLALLEYYDELKALGSFSW
ncbi:MAG: hypothetical protein ABJ275_10965 [Maricaulaceae bacterium]